MQKKYIGSFLSLALIGFLSVTGLLLSNKKLLSQKWLYRSKASETSQSSLVATFMGQDNSYDRVRLFSLQPNLIPDIRFRLDGMKEGMPVKFVEVTVDGDKGIYRGKCCEQLNWWELVYQDPVEKKDPWAFAYVEGLGATRSLFVDSYNPLAGKRTFAITITYKDDSTQSTTIEATTKEVSKITVPESPNIEESIYATSPRPVDTGDYLVGMWYFPGNGWSQVPDESWQDRWQHWSQYKDINPVDELRREPYGTYYPNIIRYPGEKPWKMDYDTKWAVEHGIGYMVFDWFWEPTRRVDPSTNQVICGGDEGTLPKTEANQEINAFLNSRYKNSIRYAIMMTNYISDPDCVEEEARQITDYITDKFFKQSNYLFIDGKPAMFFFTDPATDPKVYEHDHSVTTRLSAQFLNTMSTRLREKGFAGMYTSYGNAEVTSAPLYNASAAYGNGNLGQKSSDAFAPYDNLVSGYYLNQFGENGYYPSLDRYWEIAAQWMKDNVGPNAGYIPALTAGSNWAMRWYSYPFGKTGRTPESYRYQLIRNKEFLDKNPNSTFTVRALSGGGTERKKLNITYAWNEFEEGGILHPTRGDGFDYLEMIRDVFATDKSPHTDPHIVYGALKTDEVGTFQFPVLAEGSNVSTFRYGDGERGWEDYQVKTEVTPQFNTANSNSRFGINVWQTGQNYLSVYVKQSGIYGRAHNSASGDVGNEFTIYTFPQTLPAGGRSYKFDIDMWKGRINVMWDGQFTKTLYLKEAGWPWNTANPWGGISSLNEGMTSVKYQTVKTTSLSAYPVLYGPVTKAVGQTITAGDANWTNYRVDYMVTPVWGDDPNQHVGIKVRKQGDNYIWVFFRPNGLYWTWNTPGDPGYHELKTFKEFPVQSGRAYKVTIEARLKRLMVYVDGEIAGIIDDLSTLAPGISAYDKGGIETYGYHVAAPEMKDILVRHIFDYGQPQGVVPSIPPTPTPTLTQPPVAPTPTATPFPELICERQFPNATCETPLGCMREGGHATNVFCGTDKFCCTH